ncbi:H2A histone family member X, partial [Macrolepiota fuliginosa MF-IS2]
SQRLGLKFPVARIKRQMRKSLTHNQKYVHISAAVYLAGVLDFLVGELLEAAGDTARGDNKAKITPRHIFLAIKKDNELDVLLQDAMISEGGV